MMAAVGEDQDIVQVGGFEAQSGQLFVDVLALCYTALML